MKNLIVIIASVCLSVSSFAKNKSIEERVTFAADLLASVVEGSNTFTVTPNSDPKKMLLELAMSESMVDSEQDFEERWSEKSNELWEVDGSSWGLENQAGAYDYVSGGLEQALQEGEQTDADKIKYADGILKLNRAMNILRSIKSVKYGVAPMGAVQCGVTFPSLMIMDTENGKIHQIVMEGSGC